MSNWPPYSDEFVNALITEMDDNGAPAWLLQPDGLDEFTTTQAERIGAALDRQRFRIAVKLRTQWERAPGLTLPEGSTVPLFMFVAPVPDDASELIDPM